MKRSNVNLQSCVVALMAMTALMACGTPRQSVVPATSKDQLAVPKVNLDKDGFFSVDDCPTTHDVLDVTLNEGEYAINLVLVSSDDLPMTTVPLDEDYGVTQDVVHFLDANFDGKVDILVGPGSNRNYSVLLLWNDEKNDFVLASLSCKCLILPIMTLTASPTAIPSVTTTPMKMSSAPITRMISPYHGASGLLKTNSRKVKPPDASGGFLFSSCFYVSAPSQGAVVSCRDQEHSRPVNR